VHRFRESRRWRQTFVAICLPYLLVSVLVDFVHVHLPAGAATTQTAAFAAPSRSTPQPDYTCTSCAWLRSGVQLLATTGDALAVGITATAFVFAPDAVRPDTPLAQSAPLRGPPSSLLG
jgi:hypothetical protein